MPVSSLPLPHAPDTPTQGPVIACVDGSHRSQEIAQTAAHYAQSFDRPLVLYRVLEHSHDPAALPDPLEWNIRRQEARRDLRRLRDSLPEQPGEVSLELNEGDWLVALADRVGETGALLVIGAPGSRESRDAGGRVARLVTQAPSGSLLLVPPGYAPRGIGSPRIAVPLDGSNFAEAALAEAARLARRSHAELLLLHVIPESGLTDFGPPATSDLELRIRLDRRNAQAAGGFLERTRRRLVDQGLAVRSLCLKGDPRTSLLRALGEEAPDLVVLSAKGQGGKRCNDLSIGGTASYLLDHLTGPVMLVRPSGPLAGRALPIAPGERLPGSAHMA
ncbi:universal stress protein [Novosphingobium album (ex Liu et al. 2023)]|uniref:Universal stress protein n=1 Tax=Novosphingobium album (ex Liu et al. 2023) TaxID=3031130 RepID=A0ABT5WUZ4_9SPHN|nr:universal stress protein [Novosphingobium album (ex Liu et al. 2023)]MDE8653687.1 universal stress protein [Novosphingobium album (ex Liu et al. 2023)]